MNVENEVRRNNEQHALTLDEIPTTQPELGPSIPDGGFGWVVFIGTLFFQALIPCLLLNFGVFLAFSKLENGTSDDKNVLLWDDKILYVPLFFCITRSFFDSFTRNITSTSTTPRLIGVVGTCLTCAGLLFMWMGMTGNSDDWLFVPAGILSGLGASFLMVQCESLLTQYFRLKLPALNQISHFVTTLGFMVAPVALGHNILNTRLSHIILWYQAIILQGLVVSLLFRKPLYLKSKQRSKPYQFVLSNPDDEEDILSKNSRELQIKRQTSSETHVSKIPLEQPQPGTSTSSNAIPEFIIEDDKENNGQKGERKKWEKFDDEDEDEENYIKYAKLHNWEIFDEEEEQKDKTKNWERFEDDGSSSPRIINDLSLAEETNTSQVTTRPSSLFSDFPVNNNNTYAYDDEIIAETTNSNVFMPNDNNNENIKKRLDVLKEATFYKSLLLMVANSYSSFVFYTLFPSYLFIEADSVNIRHMTGLMGAFSFVNLVFLCFAFWIPIDKNKRAICFWLFYWIGSVGYFMVADFTNETVLLLGAVQIVLSIGSLEHISKPLLILPIRGTSNENQLLTIFSSFSLFLFLLIDVTFKTCFRLVAILHFFTGTLWLSNFAYKKLRLR